MVLYQFNSVYWSKYCLGPVNYEYISIVPNTNWNLCYYKAISRCDGYAECNTPLPINPESKNNGQIFIN